MVAHRTRSIETINRKPEAAHAIATIRVGGDGLVVETGTAVGFDTIFGSLPPPMLGGNVRLRRMSVLWHGRGRRSGVVPGRTTIVGATTILE